ncbi:MAG: hypothetical protein ACRDNP_03950 [Gaiellaceae bacterium]
MVRSNGRQLLVRGTRPSAIEIYIPLTLVAGHRNVCGCPARQDRLYTPIDGSRGPDIT